MSDFGDILGSLFGGGSDDATQGIADVVSGMFEGGRQEERADVPVVHERYLCGGPKTLGVNDR